MLEMPLIEQPKASAGLMTKSTPNFTGATAARPNDLAQASDCDIFSSAATALSSCSRILVNSTPSN